MAWIKSLLLNGGTPLFVAALVLNMGGATARGVEPDTRTAPPSPAAQHDVEKTILEIYRTDFGNHTTAGRGALGKKLLAATDNEGNDGPTRYVLLQDAIDCAADAGDIATAQSAEEKLDQSFRVDGMNLRLAMLDRLSKSPASREEVAQAANNFVDEAIDSDHLELAAKAVSISTRVAQQSHSADLIAVARANAAAVDRTQNEARRVQAARKRLAADAEDPLANSVVGWSLCTTGAWEKGIPILAKGSNVSVGDVAKREMGPNVEPAAMALAWRDLSRTLTASQSDSAQLRSAYWYGRALPSLKGLARAAGIKQIIQAGNTPLAGTFLRRQAAWDVSRYHLPPLINWVSFARKINIVRDVTIDGSLISFASKRGLVLFDDPVPREASMSFALFVGDDVLNEGCIVSDTHPDDPPLSFHVMVAADRLLRLTACCDFHELYARPSLEFNKWMHVTIAWSKQGGSIVIDGKQFTEARSFAPDITVLPDHFGIGKAFPSTPVPSLTGVMLRFNGLNVGTLVARE